MRKDDMSRREFTAASVMALLAGVTVTVSGCGGGGGNPAGPNPTPNPTPTPAPSGDKPGAVSDNHGHTATVTAAHVTAGGAVTLNLLGSADHPHTLQLTAAEVQQIGAGTRVAKSSSTEVAHNHIVTFN
jgi:hypothetical protein